MSARLLARARAKSSTFGFALSLLILLPGIASGAVSTVASGPPLQRPTAVRVSPDGTTLYVADPGAGAVFRIPLAGGTPVPLASAESTGLPGFTGIGALALSRDGASLFVTAAGGRVFRVSTADGAATEIAALDGAELRGIALNPDETMIYLADGRAGNLVRVPVAGGTPETVNHATLGAPLDVVISPDGRNAYVCAANPTAIYRIPTVGGAPTQIGFDPPLSRPRGIDIAGNGSLLFITDAGAESGEPAPRLFIMTVVTGEYGGLQSNGALRAPAGCGLSPDVAALYVADLGAAGAPPSVHRVEVLESPAGLSTSTLWTLGLAGLALMGLGGLGLRHRLRAGSKRKTVPETATS